MRWARSRSVRSRDVEGEALRAVCGGAIRTTEAEENHGDRLDAEPLASRRQRQASAISEQSRPARTSGHELRGREQNDISVPPVPARTSDGRVESAPARPLRALAVGDSHDDADRPAGDQDRRRRATVLRTIVDAGQHDQRGGRRQVEGDGQQHGDGRHGTDAGQNADQRAEHAAQQRVGQVLEGNGDAQAEREIVEQIHVTKSRARCRCSCPIRP